jgi:DNA-binding NtrC family response regulator
MVRPIGGDEAVPFDARIVTATNRSLEAEVDEKRFREDLYYRINVVHVNAPALRERGSDVLLLAQHFFVEFAKKSGKHVGTITPEAVEKLVAYNWPGNVRELENCIERAMALLRGDALTVDDLPEKIRQYRPDKLILATDQADEVLTIDELDRRYIQRVLALVGDNKSRAADLLGLDRRTLYRRLDRYRGPHEREQ